MPRSDDAAVERTPLLVVSDAPDLVSTDERTIVDLRGQGPLLSLGQYRYLTAQYPLPPQMHPSLLVLALPQRGTFDFHVDGCVAAVEPGQLICIAPRSEYSVGWAAQPRGELVWMLLEASAMTGVRVVGEAIDILLADGALVRAAPQRATDLLTQALEDPHDAGDLTREWRRSLCTAAVIEFARDSRNAQTSAPLHPGLRRAADWVHQHIDEPITVGQLIEASQMSSTHFYDQFVRSFGTSPKDYVLRAKLVHAESLLSTTDETITQIAHTLGFSTSQHFGTAFRRYKGVTPSQYRSRNHGTASTT